MKYISKAYCSALLPKILGSYEEPIHDWIGEVINNKKHKNIINIGCAEGYYAVGFALHLPNSKITAYDINIEARKALHELQTLNKIKNIEIKAACSHLELNRKSKSNTLMFCDIEGAEKDLLDPTKVPNLKYVDIIVETHDCFFPGITEELIRRFYHTHRIRIVVDYPHRQKKYITPIKFNDEQYKTIINEKRPLFMKYMYLESICEIL